MPQSNQRISAATLAARQADEDLAVVEVNQSVTLAYDKAHVPGALGRDWQSFLWDENVRDFPAPGDFARRLGAAGIGNDTPVVFYGNPLQYGTYAWWTFRYCGHQPSLVLDGGLKAWEQAGNDATAEQRAREPRRYIPHKRNEAMRALRDDVLRGIADPGVLMLDVRSPEEYAGEAAGPPGTNHGAQRYGRIPGAKHRYYETLLTDSGTFKTPADIKALLEGSGVTWDKDIIIYCRLSHRASLVYFAITQLVGYPRARVYDGSWTEWGSLVGVPIERP